MKKILVITPYFYPHTGGSQQYMEDIYYFLLKVHPQISVDVLCYNTTKNAPYFERYRGFQVFRIPCFNVLPDQFSLPHPLKLIKFLYQHRDYDIIHLSTRFFDSSWWGPLCAKMLGKKVLLTDHCANFPIHKYKLISMLAAIIDKGFSKLFLRFFDQIYSTNKANQRFLKENFKIDSKVIYGGVDTKTFKPKKEYTRKKLNIIFVGRMINSKGAKLLFDIAKSIKDHNFYFAGSGPLESEFKKEIKMKSLKHIKILGKLNKKQVASLMASSDILTHPSYHHEGFPNVLTEAGTCKLAVIAADVGGSREIIIHNKTGLLIKPNDRTALEKSLKKLINKKRLRKHLANNLYQHMVKNFSWQKLSDQLYKQLKQLSKQGRIIS